METETHRWDALHYVATGEHQCMCGWVPRATIREAIAKRAIGSHAAAAGVQA